MYLLPEIAEIAPLVWVSFALFCTAWLIQLYLWLFVFTRILKARNQIRNSEKEGVSVIVCARNEAGRLKKFLPLILEQDYPEFELIVVDDASADETTELLAKMAAANPRLRFTSIPANGKRLPGKKLALTIGLKAAKYERVLLSDADCYPVSKHWLQLMTAPLKDDKQIVLGYGAYESGKGLLNKLIRYETTFTAIQYLSWALRGRPYMGVGRNLAYKRSHFFNNKGFSNHYHIPSGDDDLFVNETANRHNTAVVYEPGAHTRSLPAKSFKKWWKQKQRHLAVGKHYSRSSRARIGLELGSRLLVYAGLLWLGLYSPLGLITLSAFILLLLIKALVFKMAARRLDEKYLLLPSLLFDPLLPILLATVWFSGLFATKDQTWS